MFIRNGGNYFLTDLLIYADGLIDCWGLVTVEEFAEELRSGWVATTFEDGARASAHHVAAWNARRRPEVARRRAGKRQRPPGRRVRFPVSGSCGPVGCRA
ncbi:hypothetical protein [Kitasatospora sp. NPDC006786]|uniref:DUF7638 domain-containing protein n=1 Tax=unclassified Kitasatospora TaxID=2633591 RepID=UPI0033C3D031